MPYISLEWNLYFMMMREDGTSKENNYEHVDKKIILSAAKYWYR